MSQGFEMPPQLRSSDGNARRNGRVRCQWTHCDLGEILDLSASGMRVRSRKKIAAEVGARISAIIEGMDGPFDVSGGVVWKKKVGLFKWEMGIEFVDLTPEANKALVLIARSAL